VSSIGDVKNIEMFTGKTEAAHAVRWSGQRQDSAHAAILVADLDSHASRHVEIAVRVDGEIFRAYVEQVLVPTLRPGDIVVMDNSPTHYGLDIRTLIEAVGASLLYLPPYSPDFNPIENAFAKLKALLRKAAARTIDALWNAIRDVLPAFTADECANYFTASGYEPE